LLNRKYMTRATVGRENYPKLFSHAWKEACILGAQHTVFHARPLCVEHNHNMITRRKLIINVSFPTYDVFKTKLISMMCVWVGWVRKFSFFFFLSLCRPWRGITWSCKYIYESTCPMSQIYMQAHTSQLIPWHQWRPWNYLCRNVECILPWWKTKELRRCDCVCAR
jgi:hypothetical protein